jgi:glycosyltransferase involved in cell wall biosynthesis
MTPVISIIIPAYNRAEYVGAAVESVLAQTRGDFEAVVWDDGSTDGTIEAAQKAARGDPHVRVIAGGHAGVSVSINAAAKVTSGEYLGIVDSDDQLELTALEETAALLDARPDVGMVYTSYQTMDVAGRIIGPGSRTKIPYSKDRLLIDFMTFHFRLMRREVFDAVGGMDSTLDSAEDYDLCLKLSEITQIAHLPKPLYRYRVHKGSVSSEQRLKQIMSAKEAIARALKRRGLDVEYDIEVELVGRFSLRRKGDSGNSGKGGGA